MSSIPFQPTDNNPVMYTSNQLEKQTAYIQKHADHLSCALDLLSQNCSQALSEQNQTSIIEFKKEINYIDQQLNKQGNQPINLILANRIIYLFQSIHELYLNSFEKIAEQEDVSTIIIGLPYLLKHFERIDRLVSLDTTTSVSQKIQLFLTRYSVCVDELPTEEKESSSANQATILKDLDAKKIGFYKPIPTSPSPFSEISNNDVSQRQVAAYLFNQNNGHYIDVPLSCFGFSNKNNSQGSIQTFRNKRQELNNLSSMEHGVVA